MMALFVPFGKLSEDADNANKPKPGTASTILNVLDL
jgi:hypothetical protein